MEILWLSGEFTDEASCRQHASACQSETAIPYARRLAVTPDRLPQSTSILNQRFLNSFYSNGGYHRAGRIEHSFLL